MLSRLKIKHMYNIISVKLLHLLGNFRQAAKPAKKYNYICNTLTPQIKGNHGATNHMFPSVPWQHQAGRWYTFPLNQRLCFDLSF